MRPSACELLRYKFFKENPQENAPVTILNNGKLRRIIKDKGTSMSKSICFDNSNGDTSIENEIQRNDLNGEEGDGLRDLSPNFSRRLTDKSEHYKSYQHDVKSPIGISSLNIRDDNISPKSNRIVKNPIINNNVTSPLWPPNFNKNEEIQKINSKEIEHRKEYQQVYEEKPQIPIQLPEEPIKRNNNELLKNQNIDMNYVKFVTKVLDYDVNTGLILFENNERATYHQILSFISEKDYNNCEEIITKIIGDVTKILNAKKVSIW